MNRTVAFVELVLDLLGLLMCTTAPAAGLIVALHALLVILPGGNLIAFGISAILSCWLLLSTAPMIPVCAAGVVAYSAYLLGYYAVAEKYFRRRQDFSVSLQCGRYPGAEIWQNGWIAHCLHKQHRWAEAQLLYSTLMPPYRALRSREWRISGFELVLENYRRLLVFLEEHDVAEHIKATMRKPVWAARSCTYIGSAVVVIPMLLLSCVYMALSLTFAPECLLQMHAYQLVERGVHSGWFGAERSIAGQNLIARALIGQNRFAEAEQQMRTQVESLTNLIPDSPELVTESLVILGDSLAGQNRNHEALHYYRRALHLLPKTSTNPLTPALTVAALRGRVQQLQRAVEK